MRSAHLLGPLAHLAALLLQATSALLLPLPAHLRVRLLPWVGLMSTAAKAKHLDDWEWRASNIVRAASTGKQTHMTHRKPTLKPQNFAGKGEKRRRQTHGRVS